MPRSTVEAFSPPYLFRGPRPEVVELQTTTLARGGTGAVFGYYLLFAMVDDIPSVGRIVRIAP